MCLIVQFQVSWYLFETCLTVLAFYIDVIAVDGLNAADSLNGVEYIVLLPLDDLGINDPIEIIRVLLVVIVWEAVVFIEIFGLLPLNMGIFCLIFKHV
jgi:hypothetical protein